MEQKKYTDVTRLGHKTTLDVLKEGDQIVIQEKIDGANASFKVENGEIFAFSRNTQLSEGNTLGGFYEFAKNLDADKLLAGVIYFGEWTNAHKVRYPEHEKQFFLYDIYNTHIDKYVNFSMVKDESKRLGLNLVPVFYEGEYQSFEHLQSFVGRTDIGGKLGDVDTGEGIVVKNVSYIDRFGNQKFVKLVTDVFREVQKQKAPKDPKRELTQEQQFVDMTVTDARVEKMLYKFVDEGVLDEHFGIEDMGTILKHMNPRILEDILKEESDSLPSEHDPKELSKAVSRTVVKIVKPLVNK